MLAQLVPTAFLDSNQKHSHNGYSTLISATPLPLHTTMMDPSTTTLPRTSPFFKSCNRVGRITISWYITPESTSTFCLILDTRFSAQIFYFFVTDLTQYKATFELDQLTTFEIFT